VSQHFEELCSKYMDDVLSHEEEAELLGYLQQPENEERFLELTRLNDEIVGLLSAPVPDETMSELVLNEIKVVHGRTTRVCEAIIETIVNEAPRGVSTRSRPRHTPIQMTLSSPAGALTLSICLHAAMVILILGLRFGVPAQNHSSREVVIANPEMNARTVAQLQAVTGSVFKNSEEGRVQLNAGAAVQAGQNFETVGSKSTAQLAFKDGTELVLDADTQVSGLSDGASGAHVSIQGKLIRLEHGVLRASVTKQPKDQPMVLLTNNAEIVVLGTKFTLTNSAGMTRLDVTEGLVRLKRLSDGFSVQVKAGEYAVVASGVQMAARPIPTGPQSVFVKGVNLKGGPVVIDGNLWMSHAEALQDGLEVKFTPTDFDATSTKVSPIPAVDAETSKMLNTRLYSWQDDMVFTQEIENGDYDVYLWAFEPAKPYSRSFNILVQDKQVSMRAGRLKLGAWQKYGPYSARVNEGHLKIHLKRAEGTSALSGIAIFKRAKN
jgi:hypothetical protein